MSLIPRNCIAFFFVQLLLVFSSNTNFDFNILFFKTLLSIIDLIKKFALQHLILLSSVILPNSEI